MLRSGPGWWGRTAFAAVVTVAAAAPAGLKQERESMAASDRGDQAAETRGYERVRQLVPRFSPAVRRLCGLRARAGRKDEAVALCREALALEESADNLAAL